MTTGTITSTNESLYANCKYHLPCGYCELKKKDCNLWQVVNIPFGGDPSKAFPRWNEVTCSTERNEDPSHPFADSVMMGGKGSEE